MNLTQIFIICILVFIAMMVVSDGTYYKNLCFGIAYLLMGIVITLFGMIITFMGGYGIYCFFTGTKL